MIGNGTSYLLWALCVDCSETEPRDYDAIRVAFYLITYLIMLIFYDTLREHIILLGASNGLAMSLYYGGVHMAVFDLTTNDKRDQFLYIQGIILAIGGAIAPFLSGILISQIKGMSGNYIVFAATCVFFFISFLVSLKVKGNPVATKRYFWEVVKNPSQE